MTPPTTGGIRLDYAGDGHFGAKRGGRNHKGTDYNCYPGEPVAMPFTARITRLATPYSNDPKWRGLHFENSEYKGEIFYLDPYFSIIGSFVKEGNTIGYAQAISKKHNGPGKPVMTDHVHLQVRNSHGDWVDTETIV